MKKTTGSLSREIGESSPFLGNGDWGKIPLSREAMPIAKKSFFQSISTIAFLRIEHTVKHAVFLSFWRYLPSSLVKLKLADMGSNIPFPPYFTRCIKCI